MGSEKIGVIGAGAWGTSLSRLLAVKGHSVDLWVHGKELCEQMRRTRVNGAYLPGVPLPAGIGFTHSLEEAARGKNTLLLAVPTHVMRTTIEGLRPHIAPDCLIVNASKGIEEHSHFLVHHMVKELVRVPCAAAAISGPTFAAEVGRDCPSALVAAAKDLITAQRVQALFSSPTFKVFTSTDLTGVEMGGALKNVIAIATGIADGLGLGLNARAAIITRGLVEIKRIGTALGARPETFAGLSGMGDLVLTCTGDLSRNRTVGIKLGQGQKLKEITAGMKAVAEGVNTVKSGYSLKQKLGIQAAIIDETYRVLYQEKDPREALKDLMKVEISTEFAGVKGLE